MSDDSKPTSVGFVITQATDVPDVWVVDVRNTLAPWYVGGFTSRDAALDWALHYLLGVHDSNMRIAVERQDEKKEAELRLKLAQAALLEVPVKKGQEN